MTCAEDFIEKPRVSPSQLKVYKDCQQAWHYGYVDKLQRLGTQKKHLEVGTYFHQLMHVYYQLLKMGQKPGSDSVIAMMQSRIEADMKDSLTADNVEIMAAVWPLILKFVSYQSPKIDTGIEVIAVEHEFFVEIEGAILHGFMDLLYRKNGKLRVRDHKTSEKINSWNDKKLMLDGQQLLYCLAMSIEYGEPVYGAEINFACTHIYKGKSPPLDQIYRLIPYEHNQATLDNYRAHVNKIASRMVAGEPERAYNDRCGSCQYHQLCNLAVRGQDISRIISSNYVTRNDHGTPTPGFNESTESSPENSETGPETTFSLSFKLP